MELKLVLGITATIAITVGFFPYIRDIFLLKTKPHIYTWLIWSITQGTAVTALWYGNGGTFAAIGIGSGALLTMFVFCLSFKYGTKNITGTDTATLIAALLAVLVWWKLDSPLIAVMMVAAIDGIGYLPTYRKSWFEPWTETVSFWSLFTLGNVLSLAALAEYNILTTAYLTTVTIASAILIAICLYRRRAVTN
jgi:hypothetical protein